MATILRPPLVSQVQPKRPIPPVEFFGGPLLTLGINPNASLKQLSDSAPIRRHRLSNDVYPNLLGTTLAPGAPATLDLPLRSGRVFDSAPSKQWIADVLQAQGFIVDQNQEANPLSLFDSAPQRINRIALDQITNLLENTLAQTTPLALPLLAVRLDGSAPSVKYQTKVEALYQPLTLGINPNAVVLQLSDSATPPKRAAYTFDPPNLLGNTLAPALGLPLNAGTCDWSAPSIKYQVRTETLYRPLTLGINPNAKVQSITDSAPPPKKAAYPFDPPNLIDNTLAEQLDLPRRATRMDWSAPPPKTPLYQQIPPNITISAPPDTTTYVYVPYLIGKTQDAATLRIQDIYCNVQVIGTSGTVTAQSPDFMSFVPRGSMITITLGGTPNNASSVLIKGPRYGQRADATRDRKFRIH